MQRAQSAGLTNVSVKQALVEEGLSADTPLHLGLAIHACGSASDIVHDMVRHAHSHHMLSRASFTPSEPLCFSVCLCLLCLCVVVSGPWCALCDSAVLCGQSRQASCRGLSTTHRGGTG